MMSENNLLKDLAELFGTTDLLKIFGLNAAKGIDEKARNFCSRLLVQGSAIYNIFLNGTIPLIIFVAAGGRGLFFCIF